MKAWITAAALAIATPAAADEFEASWLFVQTAKAMEVSGDTLTLSYDREILAFTNRPYRLHAYFNAHELEWFWGDIEDSFADNPPNAVLTWPDGAEMREAEIMLTSIDTSDTGRSISYTVVHEAGDALPQSAENVSLFIDNVLFGKKYVNR
jgi:hypothetical protein